MRWRTGSFSRVSTGDSDIPSSCEMKDKTAFKPLQGSPAFFLFRTSRSPFYLRQKTQGLSHIQSAEGKLLLRYLWKVGLPLQSKRGNQLSSRDNMGCTELSSSCSTETDVPLDLRRVSQSNSGVSLKIVKPLVVYVVECRMAMEPMQGKWASSRVDFGVHPAILCS